MLKQKKWERKEEKRNYIVKIKCNDTVNFVIWTQYI